MPVVAAPRRCPQQRIEIVHVRERERLFGGELPPGWKIFQQFAHLAIIHDLRPMAGSTVPAALSPDRIGCAPIEAGDRCH